MKELFTLLACAADLVSFAAIIYGSITLSDLRSDDLEKEEVKRKAKVLGAAILTWMVVGLILRPIFTGLGYRHIVLVFSLITFALQLTAMAIIVIRGICVWRFLKRLARESSYDPKRPKDAQLMPSEVVAPGKHDHWEMILKFWKPLRSWLPEGYRRVAIWVPTDRDHVEVIIFNRKADEGDHRDGGVLYDFAGAQADSFKAGVDATIKRLKEKVEADKAAAKPAPKKAA